MFLIRFISFLLCFGLGTSFNLSAHGIDSQNARIPVGIIGGRNSSITKHPYQVALIHGENEFLCSAAVISRRWVVTLAVCVYEISPTNFRLRTGSDDATNGGAIYQVAKVVVYPTYNNLSVDYDYALLKTKEPFKFGKKLKSIKLAKSKPRAGLQASVSGWGWLNVTVPFTKVILEAPSKVVKHKNCKKSYIGVVTNRMICSFNKDAGPCYESDVGSLLVSRNTLYGLYSFGCGDKTYPQVYMNVAAVKKWIQNTIRT